MNSTPLTYYSEHDISAKYHAQKKRRTLWCAGGLLGTIAMFVLLSKLQRAHVLTFPHADTIIQLFAIGLAPIFIASISGMLSVRWAEQPWTQELSGKDCLQIEQWMVMYPEVDQYIKSVQSNHRSLCVYDYQVTERFRYTPEARQRARQYEEQAASRMLLASKTQ